jgi:serine/threonine protein kinase
MHTKKVLHRDIKGPNLLITRDNVLKIADWGLSRTAPERNQKLTNGNRIVSLWWRAPELLLGSHDYGPEIDIWSVGCVFGEMKAGQAMLQGKDVINQLELIYQLMGSPTGEVEQKYKEMPNWEQMIITRQYPNRLRKVYENIFLDNHALDLLEKLLDLNPKGTNPVGGGPAVGGRITATKALDEPYFWSGEIAPDPRELPRFNIDGVTDMIEAERRREEHAAREEQRKIALEALEEKAKREKERSTVAGAGAKSGGLPPRGKAKPLEIKSGAAKYTLVKKNSSVPSNLSSLSATSSSSEQTDTSTSILKAKATPMDAPRNAGGYKRPRPDDQK